MAGSVEYVSGLKDLQRAFKQLPKDLSRELPAELKVIAEPVRADAERLASEEISHIGPKWSQMRVGVAPGLVYVAPKKRGLKQGARKRPNFAGLLLDKALDPALEMNEAKIVARLEFMLDHLGQKHGF